MITYTDQYVHRFQNKGCINNTVNIAGLLALCVECSPTVRETWVQSEVESYQRLEKWYLMLPCLTLSIVRYGLRVKRSNPGNGVVPFPKTWCNSY